MKVVIPHSMNYQQTVQVLLRHLRSWNLGCHVAHPDDDDAQTIVDLGDPSNTVVLTEAQKTALSTALPGIQFA